MKPIELIRNIAQSLPDYELSLPSEAPETISVITDIKISCGLEISRQDDKPKAGEQFNVFKPNTLKSAVKRSKTKGAKSPLKIVQSIAPEWLQTPALEGRKTLVSGIIAFQKETEKVVDRVDSTVCSSCSGRGSITRARTERPSITCTACGGSGGRAVTPYVNSPGTTGHGMPTTVFRACSRCVGGTTTGPPVTKTETHTCGKCNGNGKLEKKFYKNKTFYKVFRVSTSLEIQGKEKASKSIARLRKHSPSPKTTLGELAKISPPAALKTIEKNSKLRLSFIIIVPFSKCEVLRKGRNIGTLYCVPEDGSAFAVADSQFFDRGSKSKPPKFQSFGMMSLRTNLFPTILRRYSWKR
jgi:hypothetical protein